MEMAAFEIPTSAAKTLQNSKIKQKIAKKISRSIALKKWLLQLINFCN